jgi:hypothetical protein
VVGDEQVVVIDWYGASNYARRCGQRTAPLRSRTVTVSG